MTGFSVDGLISGINTRELIAGLVAAESAPRVLLQRRAETTQQLVSALQALNTRVASLADNAGAAVDGARWDAVRGVVSGTGASVSTGNGASTGTVTFTTRSLAAAQVSLVDPAAWGDDGTLTFAIGDRTVTVTPASSSPQDVAEAIGAVPDLGVTATLVRVGGTDAPEYLLQLSGPVGAAGAFDVHLGAGTGSPPLTGRADAPTSAADAEIVLWAGTGSERVVRSPSNTFEGLPTGTDVTLTGPGDGPVTVTVSRDASARTALVTDLVGAMRVVLSEIASRTSTTTGTDAQGGTVVRGGLFAGDSAVRGLRTQLLDAFSHPVGGRSPADALGISVTRSGEIELDREILDRALAQDPEATAAFVQQLSARVQTAAVAASDRFDGTLTAKITGQQDLRSSLELQVADWDTRIERRSATLLAQFTAMETTLARLQSQSSWLASQLGSVSANAPR